MKEEGGRRIIPKERSYSGTGPGSLSFWAFLLFLLDSDWMAIHVVSTPRSKAITMAFLFTPKKKRAAQRYPLFSHN